MRKYIKAIREHSQDNSIIFKEAKRRFHYQPDSQAHRRFLKSKTKQYEQRQGESDEPKWKEADYSSVKELKGENAEGSESSWLSKLVSGIQENMMEEVGVARRKERKLSEVREEEQKAIELDARHIIVKTEHYSKRDKD